MCDFITLATVGLGIAQGVMGYAGANAQHEQRMEEVRQNADNAARSAENQYAALNIRAMQEDAASNQAQQETNIEAAQARATAITAAGEGNVGGLSVEHVLRDMYAQQGRYDATLDANQRMNRSFIAGEKKAVQAGGQNQINAMPIPEKPSFAPYLINTFSSGLGAYTNYKQRQT